jgi:hypothetical protein
MVNPYASPADSESSRPVKSRVLRMAGLTSCFFLSTLSLAIGCYGLWMNYAEYRRDPNIVFEFPILEFLAGLTLYFGFGTCWFLAGILFLWSRRVAGWIAIAVGVAIPIVLFSMLGV